MIRYIFTLNFLFSIKYLFCTLADEVFTTEEFQGVQELILSVRLSGGKGDNAWQHAQLFRQSVKDKNLFPLDIEITFE